MNILKTEGRNARISALVLVALLFAAFLLGTLGRTAGYALEDPIITDTQCAYLYNITNDKVLYQKNTELTIYPASTVKIMTALVALEQFKGDWDAEITVTRDMVKGVRGNNINLRADEIVTFRDMINCLVVGGSNDCANVIAYTVCGGVEEFVKLMNQKAVALGMYDTSYTNITGMHDPDMHTTLADIVKLARHAIVQYDYYDIAKQFKYEMDSTNRSGTRKVYTRNAFMTSYYSSLYYSTDVSGINAGSTEEAGYCAVVTAEHDGTSYLAIAMGSGSDGDNIYSFTTIRSMLDWAYENFGYVTIVRDSEVIREIPVNMSASFDRVALYPKETIDVFMEGDINVETDIRRTTVLLSDELDAPLKQGDVAGYLTLSYNDEILARIELVVRNDIPRSDTLYLSSTLKQIFSSGTAIACFVLALVGAVIYIIRRAFSGGDEKTGEDVYHTRDTGSSPEELTYRMPATLEDGKSNDGGKDQK